MCVLAHIIKDQAFAKSKSEKLKLRTLQKSKPKVRLHKSHVTMVMALCMVFIITFGLPKATEGRRRGRGRLPIDSFDPRGALNHKKKASGKMQMYKCRLLIH